MFSLAKSCYHWWTLENFCKTVSRYVFMHVITPFSALLTYFGRADVSFNSKVPLAYSWRVDRQASRRAHAAAFASSSCSEVLNSNASLMSKYGGVTSRPFKMPILKPGCSVRHMHSLVHGSQAADLPCHEYSTNRLGNLELPKDGNFHPMVWTNGLICASFTEL